MKNYIPNSKFDRAAVKALHCCTFEAIKADIPELLIWLQDMNWPVASGVVNYLRPHLHEIEEEVLEILQGDDANWKYGIISSLIGASPQPPGKKLALAIKRIASHPTSFEHQEEVDDVAKDVVEKFGL